MKWPRMISMENWYCSCTQQDETRRYTQFPWYTIFKCPWFQTWWRHQMETFSALLALCAGNSPVLVNSPHKGQWRGALMFSLICVRINDWVNNREAGDLRRHKGHYDVSVMICKIRGCDNDIGYPSEKSSHYSDVVMSPMACQITKFTSVYSTVYSGAEQRKRQRIEFPSQRASNEANVSIWWRHHVKFREAMFVQSINFSCQIVLKICTGLDSDTADLYANFWNDITTE